VGHARSGALDRYAGVPAQRVKQRVGRNKAVVLESNSLRGPTTSAAPACSRPTRCFTRGVLERRQEVQGSRESRVAPPTPGQVLLPRRTFTPGETEAAHTPRVGPRLIGKRNERERRVVIVVRGPADVSRWEMECDQGDEEGL